MAIFNFTVPIYGFDQWSAAASTNNTVSYPVGTTFTLDPSAVLTVIDVQDDDGNPANSPDNFFDDGFIDTPGDGSTPSTANNDQVLTQAVTVNGQSFNVGDQVELEFAFETTTGETFWVIRIANVNVGISGSTLPQPGTTYEVASSSDGRFSPIPDVPCFAAGSLVATPDGHKAIETIAPGDLVMTVDNGAQPVVWAGARHLSAMELRFFPHLRPVKISRNALSADAPADALIVSPNHRIMVCSPKTALYFGETEVLVAAKALVNGRTVLQLRENRGVSYHHLLLPRHEVILVNGQPSESLYPANGMFAPEELLELDLFGHDFRIQHGLVRPELRAFEASLIAA